jgi:pantothenate kinase
LQRGGQTLSLRSIKGAPETYDSAAALRTVCAARADEPVELRYPVYSRVLHDPMPEAGSIQPQHRLLLFEGNYWLLDHLPWNQAHTCFDQTVFLRGDPQTLIAGLRERFLRGGRNPQAAEAHIQAVDVPNMHLILDQSIRADWVIHKADGRQILNLTPSIPAE